MTSLAQNREFLHSGLQIYEISTRERVSPIQMNNSLYFNVHVTDYNSGQNSSCNLQHVM